MSKHLVLVCLLLAIGLAGCSSTDADKDQAPPIPPADRTQPRVPAAP